MIERDWLWARHGRRYSKRDIVSHWLHRRTILVYESNLTFLFKSFVTFFLPTIRRYPILLGHNETWPNKGRGRRKRGTKKRETRWTKETGSVLSGAIPLSASAPFVPAFCDRHSCIWVIRLLFGQQGGKRMCLGARQPGVRRDDVVGEWNV